jgi:hypothetical protein
MEGNHGDDTDDSIEGQQQQTPPTQAGRSSPIVLTSQVNLLQLRRQTKVLLKVTSSPVEPETGPELSRKKWRMLQPSALTSSAVTSHTSSTIPNPRIL